MASTFQLELVAADRVVWSGEATMVIARTLEGEVGILANHAPLLGVLAPGAVEIRSDDGAPLVAAVDGGFLSVAHNRISILAERADLAEDIDQSEARRELERAQQEGDGSERSERGIAAFEARVAVAERASSR
jgi:F-type H+-transporting ATPase subunit epsilon